MHVAARYREILNPSSPNLENMCPLARHPTLPNFVTLRQKVCEIAAVENLCFRKSGLTKFTKIGADLLRTNARHRAKFHRDQSNDVREKSYRNCLHPSNILAPQSSPDVQQGPLWQPAKFRRGLKTPLRDICCHISSISLTS